MLKRTRVFSSRAEPEERQDLQDNHYITSTCPYSPLSAESVNDERAL